MAMATVDITSTDLPLTDGPNGSVGFNVAGKRRRRRRWHKGGDGEQAADAIINSFAKYSNDHVSRSEGAVDVEMSGEVNTLEGCESASGDYADDGGGGESGGDGEGAEHEAIQRLGELCTVGDGLRAAYNRCAPFVGLRSLRRMLRSECAHLPEHLQRVPHARIYLGDRRQRVERPRSSRNVSSTHANLHSQRMIASQPAIARQLLCIIVYIITISVCIRRSLISARAFFILFPVFFCFVFFVDYGFRH